MDANQREFRKLPGLYRILDLPLVISPGADYEVLYAETTADGTPLFAVLRRLGLPAGIPGEVIG